eukprot:36931-Rhodomonas_salina.1
MTRGDESRVRKGKTHWRGPSRCPLTRPAGPSPAYLPASGAPHKRTPRVSTPSEHATSTGQTARQRDERNASCDMQAESWGGRKYLQNRLLRCEPVTLEHVAVSVGVEQLSQRLGAAVPPDHRAHSLEEPVGLDHLGAADAM